MRDNLYSSKSDVWAFGVVLWEIGTLGKPFLFHLLRLWIQSDNLVTLRGWKWIWFETRLDLFAKYSGANEALTFLRIKYHNLLTVFCLFFLRSVVTGGFPYPTVGNHELLAYLSSGQRLQRPENCSEQLYELMKHCWTENPEDRPYFSDIVAKLEPAHQRIYVDFNDLGPNYVFPPTTEDMLTKLKEDDKNSHRL